MSSKGNQPWVFAVRRELLTGQPYLEHGLSLVQPGAILVPACVVQAVSSFTGTPGQGSTTAAGVDQHLATLKS